MDATTFSIWDVGMKNQYNEYIMKDAKTLLYIQQGVIKVIFPRIMRASTLKEAWEILKNEFKGSEKVISIKLQSL